MDSLKQRTKAGLDSLTVHPKLKSTAGNLSKTIEGYSINIDKVSNIDIPELSLPPFDDSGIPNVNMGNLSPDLNADIDLPGGLPEVALPTEQLNNVSQASQGLSQDVNALKEGSLDEVQQLPSTIEQRATNIDAVNELASHTESIESLKSTQGPEALKEQMIEQVSNQAIDHFEGKGEVLKETMDKISKYKMMYSSVSSLSDLPKRPPNPMKEKPFIERVIPGIAFQISFKYSWQMDFAPYMGYRYNGKINAGLGWNQRLAFTGEEALNSQARVYGPRVFGEYLLMEGLTGRLEVETMNTFVPPLLKQTTNPSEGHREWVLAVIAGIKKTTRYTNG